MPFSPVSVGSSSSHSQSPWQDQFEKCQTCTTVRPSIWVKCAMSTRLCRAEQKAGLHNTHWNYFWVWQEGAAEQLHAKTFDIQSRCDKRLHSVVFFPQLFPQHEPIHHINQTRLYVMILVWTTLGKVPLILCTQVRRKNVYYTTFLGR